MKQAIKILNRTIGVPFYQRNAGLFLFLFILLFGVVHGNELWLYHLSLALAILDSNVFMAIVFLVWLLYTVKCVQFAMKSFSEPKNSFLYVIGCLSKREQLISLFVTHFFLFLPVVLYALFIIGVALYAAAYGHIVLIIVYILLLCFLSALLYQHKITYPDSGKSLYSIPFIRVQFRKSYPAIFIFYLINDLKIVFVITKFFSATILIAFLNGFFINVADSRIAFLGLLIGLMAHSVMVFEFRKFEEVQLSFSRNLPVSLLRRFLWIAAIYTMVLIPEWVILGSAVPKIVSFADFIQLAIFGVSFLVSLHCILYWLKLETEIFLQCVFGLFCLSFFLILYKAYWLMLSLMLLFSLFIFFNRYFRFEKISEES